MHNKVHMFQHILFKIRIEYFLYFTSLLILSKMTTIRAIKSFPEYLSWKNKVRGGQPSPKNDCDGNKSHDLICMQTPKWPISRRKNECVISGFVFLDLGTHSYSQKMAVHCKNGCILYHYRRNRKCL